MKLPVMRATFGLNPRLERALGWMLCLWLIGCVSGFIFASCHWPMVGDAIFMHYVVFLSHHGMAPYRDIVDMNLPGSYLLDASVMWIFGTGSTGWRIYDFVLLALSAISFLSILRPQGRLAGLLCASLFILVHGRDGVGMSGERDFAASVCMLCAVALLLSAYRRHFRGGSTVWLMGGFGTLLGASQTIKPTLLPMAIWLVTWLWFNRSRNQENAVSFAAVLLGALLPLAAATAFLVKYKAVGAFWDELCGLIPYHASIGSRTIGFLIGHSISPLIGLFALWLLSAACLKRTGDDAERVALLLCAIFGLLSYVLQRKGFWYQRYPFLVFLLPLFISDFSRLMRSASRWRIVGFAGTLVGAVLATQCLTRLMTFDHAEPPRPLLTDLTKFGSPQSLFGHVQCMDTIGDCLDSLYTGQIVQSTGFLYDCYMLDGESPVALGLRRRFWQSIERNPPRLIVVTDSFCYDTVPSFDKFSKWPEFSTYLVTNYTLARASGPQLPVRYWSRPVTPFAYRIYVHH